MSKRPTYPLRSSFTNPRGHALVLACAALTCADATAGQSAYESQIRETVSSTLYLVWDDRQCVGDNRLHPQIVERALRDAGIGATATRVSDADVPVCEACYPACSIHLEYQVRVPNGARARALAVVERLKKPLTPPSDRVVDLTHTLFSIRAELPDGIGGDSHAADGPLIVNQYAVAGEPALVTFHRAGMSGCYRQSPVTSRIAPRARLLTHDYGTGYVDGACTRALVPGGAAVLVVLHTPGEYNGEVRVNGALSGSYRLRVYASRDEAEAAFDGSLEAQEEDVAREQLGISASSLSELARDVVR